MCIRDRSGVAARIDSGRVPIDGVLRSAFPDSYIRMALTGGEDYELLFTAPTGVISEVVRSSHVPVSVIGEIVKGPPEVRVLDEHGDSVRVGYGGWDHFRGAGTSG